MDRSFSSDQSQRPPRRRVRGSVALAILMAALFAGGCCKLIPWALAVDPSLGSLENGDAMLEPGEAVAVEPTWRAQAGGTTKTPDYCCIKPHPCTGPTAVTGTSTDPSGPAGASYEMPDSLANYGSIKGLFPGGTRSCSSTVNCYSLFVSSPAARPAQHWDTTFTETLTGASANTSPKTWTLHVGSSFSDVPRSNPFYAKIETVFHHEIIYPCARDLFCPLDQVSRDVAAMLLARAIAGGDDKIPDSGTVGSNAYSCSSGGASLFTDVPATSTACKHVHYIAARYVTLGCALSQFCPADTLSRLQMAALVAKAMVQPGGGASVPMTYGPDSATGRSYSCDSASPSLHFTDVPDTDPFCKHTHYLWAKGVLAGCGPDQFCAASDVTREEMAKFLVNAFQLKLYGP